MTTRNRPIARTPRREKMWFERHTVADVSTPAAPFIVADLLSSGLTASGLTLAQGVTVMRMFGQLTLVKSGNAATPAWDILRLGVAWVRTDVASAGAGDAQIPEPMQDGLKQTNWLQQWNVAGLEYDTAGSTGQPLNFPNRDGYENVAFDVTQMQKQPGINWKFVLIGTGGSLWEAGTVSLQVEVSTMVALP